MRQDNDQEVQQSKEFIEINFQLQYTGDEETPIKTVFDVPVAE